MKAVDTAGEQRDAWLAMADAALLALCAVDHYRASGPGGQHRNKTSSAVRLRHLASGLVVTAEERRSQHENKSQALKRLRLAIAIGIRRRWDAPAPTPPWLSEAVSAGGPLRMAERNPRYPALVAHVLDVLAAHDGQVADAAAALGTTTSQVTRFLRGDGRIWAAANALRAAAGRPPLR